MKAGKSGGRAENLYPNIALFRSAHVIADADRRRVWNVSRGKGLRRKHHSHESVRRFRFVATEICRDGGCGHVVFPSRKDNALLYTLPDSDFNHVFPKSAIGIRAPPFSLHPVQRAAIVRISSRDRRRDNGEGFRFVNPRRTQRPPRSSRGPFPDWPTRRREPTVDRSKRRDRRLAVICSILSPKEQVSVYYAFMGQHGRNTDIIKELIQ